MTTARLVADIDAAESCRLTAYPDPLTGGEPWTIGWGHTGPEVHQGMTCTQAEADAWRDADIAHAIAALDRAFPWWRQMSDPRQDVLANMAFNMGVHRLATFTNTLAAMKAGDYARAAVGMLASKWARQVGGRAVALAAQMRSGVHA